MRGEQDITEDEFVNQVMRRLQGQGGVMLSSLLPGDRGAQDWDSLPWYKKVTVNFKYLTVIAI